LTAFTFLPFLGVPAESRYICECQAQKPATRFLSLFLKTMIAKMSKFLLSFTNLPEFELFNLKSIFMGIQFQVLHHGILMPVFFSFTQKLIIEMLRIPAALHENLQNKLSLPYLKNHFR
jgi:hypothetical protein